MEYASPLPLNTVLPVNKKIRTHRHTHAHARTHTRAHTHAHTCTPTSARTHRRARTHATDTYVYTVAGLGVGFMSRSPGTSTCLGGFEWVGGCVIGCVWVGEWVCLGRVGGCIWVG